MELQKNIFLMIWINLTKKWDFGYKLNFWLKIEILTKKSNFDERWDFDQQFNFWWKIQIFWLEIELLTKNSFFYQCVFYSQCWGPTFPRKNNFKNKANMKQKVLIKLYLKLHFLRKACMYKLCLWCNLNVL